MWTQCLRTQLAFQLHSLNDTRAALQDIHHDAPFRRREYALDFCANKRSQRQNKATIHSSQADSHAASFSIPRIARLMALAIRFDRLLRAEEFRDYAELARLGRDIIGLLMMSAAALDVSIVICT
jgi:hypothetical protein